MLVKLLSKGKSWCYLLVAVLSAVAIIVIALHLLTPFCNRYKHDLELKASKLLQLPVTFEKIRLGWHGYAPALSLLNVTLLSPLTHKAILKTTQVQFSLQLFKSMWQQQLILQNITLSQATLSVVTNANGQLQLQDFPKTEPAATTTTDLLQACAWLMDLPKIAVDNLRINLIAASGVATTILVNKLHLSNVADHYLEGSLVLKQAKTTAVDLKIAWAGALLDYPHTQGHAYLKVTSDSFPELTKFIAARYPALTTTWRLAAGSGSAELLWYWQQAQIQQVQAVLHLQNLLFNAVALPQSYFLAQLSGHFKWQDVAGQQLAHGDHVLLGFTNHVWPLSNFTLKLERYPVTLASTLGQQHPAAHGDNLQPRFLSLSYFNMQDVMPLLLATSWLTPKWQQLITKLQLQGELHNITLLWQGAANDWQHITSSGTANLLSWQPEQQLPGLSTASCVWHWNGRTATINCEHTAVNAKNIFNDALDFSALHATVTMAKQQGGWLFTIPRLVLGNQDLNTRSQLQVFWPTRTAATPPTINMLSNFAIAHLEKLPHYLPRPLLQPKLLNYLDSALVAGDLVAGRVAIKGPISTGWLQLSRNTAPAINNKPIMPSIQISADLHDATLQYAAAWPAITQANGTVAFKDHKLMINLHSGLLLNLSLSSLKSELLLASRNAATQLLKVKGVLHGDLGQALALLRQSPLAATINAKFKNYQLFGPFELTLGLNIPLQLPQQLKLDGSLIANNASLLMPFLDTKLTNITGKLEFDEQQVKAAQLVAKLWGQDTSLNVFTTNDGKSPKIINATIMGQINVAALAQIAPLPIGELLSGSSNYKITGYLPQELPLLQHARIHFMTDLRGLAIKLPAPYSKAANEERKLDLELSFAKWPQYLIKLNYNDLLVAQLKISSQDELTRLDIASKALVGNVLLPYPFSKAGMLKITLAKLYLAPLPLQASNRSNAAIINPQDLPAMTLKVADLRYNNVSLGRLDLQTSHAKQGLVIDHCYLLAPDYNFISNGQWDVLDDGQHSHFTGSLVSHDMQTLLGRFAVMTDALVVTDGKVKFDFTWPQPPYMLALDKISGGFNFYVAKGRVINLNKNDNQKMGFGRMLSLFSLQTLPRRLSLDFSDLLEKGYSFDFIKGGVQLRNGNAYTNKNIVLEGPVANIRAHGRIGLLQQDYDLFLSVEPQLTSSLPVIAGALTLNPLVGAATWLVNKVVLNKQISKVVTYNYLITGPWSKPFWKALDNKSAP